MNLKFIFIQLIRLYQKGISPLLPHCCRFFPSCSDYMIECLQQHGTFIGLIKGFFRIFRCQPFFQGGFDPVQPNHSQLGKNKNG